MTKYRILFWACWLLPSYMLIREPKMDGIFMAAFIVFIVPYSFFWLCMAQFDARNMSRPGSGAGGPTGKFSWQKEP